MISSSSTNQASSTSQPDMAELLDQSEPIKSIRRGEIVVGEVMRVDPEGILVNIGHKSEGFIPVKEMRTVSEEVLEGIRAGDEIVAYVVRSDTDEGEAILSLDKARGESAWRNLQQYLDDGETIEGEIRSFNKGGAVVEVEGVQGFIPLSQLMPMARDLGEEEQAAALAQRVGQKVELQLLEVNRRRNRVILSERQALQRKREQEKDRLLEELHEGEVRTGRVSGISDFGVFVDLGGADGLVHISEMSWESVKSPAEMVQVGSEVEVFVLKVDRESRKIALSFRRLQPEPWDSINDKYYVGQIVEGVVTKLTTFGAFARIQGNIEGLIHISELANRMVQHPKEVVGEGDALNLKIIRIEPERRRLGLSLKQAEEGWEEVADTPETQQ